MSKLSPSAQAIIDAGRAAQSPSAATRASVLSGIDRALLEPAAAGSSALAQASGKAGIGKVLIGSALILALGVSYLLLREHGKGASSAPQEQLAEQVASDVLSAPPASIAPPSATASADRADEAAPEEALEPALDATQGHDAPKARPRSPHKPRVSAADSLLAEQKLIGAAQRATRDGDYATAKSLLAQHRREFAQGVLAPERNAAIAITSCLAGELDKGQSAAAIFLKTHARSPLANQVRKSCQL